MKFRNPFRRKTNPEHAPAVLKSNITVTPSYRKDSMNVVARHGTRIHRDIPPQIAVLLQELGLITIITETAPAPAPTATWGVKLVGTAHVVVKSDGFGGTTYFDGPPVGCPQEIADQFQQVVKNSTATADANLKERRRAEASLV